MAKGYIVPHTHWDREWRYPIWENRLYLAEMMDELLAVLESQQEYKCFLLDGQFVPIRDYLFLRPENVQRVKKLVGERRLMIGPWYTLPDFYPVSGESLVRNLLWGRKACMEYGEPLTVAYESFGWGQPAQMPQIYKGFGMDTVIVSKKVDESRAPNCEFVWVGADGTEVWATRLGTETRANFFMHTYMEIMNGRQYKSDDFRFAFGDGELIFHQADDPGFERDYFRLSDSKTIHNDNIREIALKSWNAMEDTLLKEDRILMDGSDATTAQPVLVEMLEKINRALEADGIIFEMSDIEEYVEVLKKKLSIGSLKKVYGELRDGPPYAVSGNALMTRASIKKLNRQAQSLLMDFAEPVCVMGMLNGDAYPEIYLNAAMEYLLLAHSHDSINGVTQDKTAEDVKYRLNQVAEIAEVLVTHQMKNLITKMDFSRYQKDDVLLMVLNPLPFERRETAEVWIDLPREMNVWDFSIEDMDGKPVDAVQISREERAVPVVSLYSRPEPFYTDRFRVLFDTGMLPAGGYKVYRVRAGSKFNRKIEAWAPNRITVGNEIAVGPNCLENEYLRAEVNGDGSVYILDKKTGVTYGPLNYFEDTGDAGDYWVYYPLFDNKTFSTKNMQAEVWLEENTELQAGIGVRLKWILPKFAHRPENYVRGQSARSNEKGIVEIQIKYTLRRSEDMLHVHTQIDNWVFDHRMRVLFDTGINAQVADAGGHFGVDHRPAVPLKDAEGRYYQDLTSQPMQDFISVSKNGAGFGILSGFFGEYDISDPGTVSLTFLRAVRNRICTEFRSFSEYRQQNGGQEQGMISFDYALVPHDGKWENLIYKARSFNVPIRMAQFSPADTKGPLGVMESFYSVSGAAVSTIKKAQNSGNLIIRVYNPLNNETTAEIVFAKPMKKAYIVNLAEERESEMDCRSGLQITLQPGKIATFEIEF